MCHFTSADRKELIDHFVERLQLIIAQAKNRVCIERFEQVFASIDELCKQLEEQDEDQDIDLMDDDTEETEEVERKS